MIDLSSALKKRKHDKVHKTMSEFKHGTLKSGGSGKKVTDRQQAIAIALNSMSKKGH